MVVIVMMVVIGAGDNDVDVAGERDVHGDDDDYEDGNSRSDGDGNW